jgi:hypothetical protein
LAELGLGVAAENLEKSIEGGGRVVVVLVEGRGSGFDTLGVGWRMSVDVCVGRGWVTYAP